jgi:hypothetical protein
MYSNEICVTEKKSFDTPLMDFNVMSIDDITQVKTKQPSYKDCIAWSESHMQWGTLDGTQLVLTSNRSRLS